MRFLVAMMKHETNTFSPVPTDLQRFRDWGLHEGEAVVRAYRGTNHPLAAFLDIAAEAGAEVVTPVAAEAMPSGYVQRAAYDYLTGRILDALGKGRYDAALLDLHGAMVAEHEPDGEGALLERMRAIAPDLPIAITFDMHGNMSEKIVRNATDGTIEVYFDDRKKPIMTAVDKTFTWGQVGVGSFDDTGNWREVKLSGVKVEGLRRRILWPYSRSRSSSMIDGRNKLMTYAAV